MKSVLVVAMFLCVACGEDFTWEDASSELAAGYCNRVQECIGEDLFPDDEVEVCYKHNMVHLCELEDTCDDSLPDGLEELAMECEEAFKDFDCFSLLAFGSLPEECEPVLDYRPRAGFEKSVDGSSIIEDHLETHERYNSYL